MEKRSGLFFLRVYPFARKGLSPLIATVLLIAFAVALGVLVMNWGKSSAPAQVPGGETPLGQVVTVQSYKMGDKALLCFDPASYNIRPDSTEYRLCGPDTPKT